LPGVVLIVLARLLIYKDAVKVKIFNSMKISLLMKTVVSDECWNNHALREIGNRPHAMEFMRVASGLRNSKVTAHLMQLEHLNIVMDSILSNGDDKMVG